MFKVFDGAAGRRRRLWVEVSLATVLGAFWLAELHFSGMDVAGRLEAQETGGNGPLESVEVGGLVEIQEGEVHRRAVVLGAGEFLRFAVEQQGVDLTLILKDPRGEKLLRVDSPNGRHGLEELLEIVEETGQFALEIRTGATSGAYRLVALEHHVPSPRDLRLVAGDHAYHRLRKKAKSQPGAAIPALEKLVKTWQELELPAREAATLGELCRARLATGDLVGAAAACDRSVTWYELLGEERTLAVALQNSGLIDLRRGDTLRAMTRYERAVKLFTKLDNPRGLAAVLDGLGVAYQRQGRIEEALDLLQEALARSQELNRPQSETMVRADLANILMTLRRPHEALEHYEKALRLLEETEFHLESLQVLGGIARVALHLQDFDRAEKTALEIAGLKPKDKDSRPKDLHARALAFNTLGHVYLAKSEKTKARRAFASALELSRRLKDQRTEAFVLLGLAFLTADAGGVQEARSLYREALAWFEESKDRRGMGIAQARLAELLEIQGQYEEAWKLISRALENVESLRHKTPRRDHRLAYFAFRQDYYGIAFNLLWKLHRARPELGWASRALVLDDRRRARELTDRLRRKHRSHHLESVWNEEERRVEGKLRALAASTSHLGGNFEITQLLSELDQIRAKIHRQPTGELPRSVEDTLSLTTEWLDEESLVLIYTLGEKRSFLWVFSAHLLEFHALPGRGDIEPEVQQFTQQLTHLWTPSAEAHRRLGERLSQQLLAPAAEPLKRSRRLILITDGELQTLPFAALPSLEAVDRFLVETHELVTLPSLTSGSLLLRQPSKKSHGRVALFADPVFSSEDPRIKEGPPSAPSTAREPDSTSYLRRSAALLDTNPWARLAGSRFEAETIFELWGQDRSTLFTDTMASRLRFLDLEFEKFGILHFATHALLYPEPDLSGLVLSLVDEDGRPRDGFLRALEISRLDLPVDLVVLSACETGLGKKIRGEGTLSLAWSFLEAGAPRVITSLWEVRDEPTSRLLVSLYRQMDRGLAPSAALRHAQLEMLGEPDSRPHDWAAFTFQGNWNRPAWDDSSLSSFNAQPRRK